MIDQGWREILLVIGTAVVIAAVVLGLYAAAIYLAGRGF